MKDIFDDRKSRASTWFRSLRDDIVAAFEALEDAQGGDAPAGRSRSAKHSARPTTARTRAAG
jgi:coproporphyrinogen III oxidase